MSNLKIGTLVKITDNSYATRLDKYEECSYINLCKDTFKIIGKRNKSLFNSEGIIVHDIIIQNQSNNNIYLHSEALVKPIEIKYISHQEAEAILSETFNNPYKIFS